MEVFKDYAYYYNTFYKNKDYAKEAEQVHGLLQRHGRDIQKVINFGCGTGKHDIELTKLGYQCEGIDVSSTMIDIARENALKEKLDIKFSVENILTFQSLSKYDAVISLFHVMSYQNTNTDIISAFVSARKALKNGGVFLFDVWYGPGVLSDKPGIRVREMEDDEKKLVRIARPVMDDKNNLVSVYYDVMIMDKETSKVESIREVHNMRYFFKPELEFMLNATGFELIDNLDCNTLKTTSYNSWTSYFIAKAVE